jgi:YVTN family beta-propeller protein
VSPDGSKVYVANSFLANSVSVISTATNMVTATIQVGVAPEGVAVTPDGSKVYVANFFSNAVSVINTATNTVIATIPVGVGPDSSASSFNRLRDLPGRPGRRTVTARVSRRSSNSIAGSMLLPRHWGSPALGAAKCHPGVLRLTRSGDERNREPRPGFFLAFDRVLCGSRGGLSAALATGGAESIILEEL